MQTINYIQHLNGIFEKFAIDKRLNPTHVSLYFALFTLWNSHYFVSEFFINREEVMLLSKIGAKSTYHRCIKQLSHWRYIRYEPSHNPFKGSRVKMFNFGTSIEQAFSQRSSKIWTSSEQVLGSHHTQIETSSEQEVGRYNKHIQTVENNKNSNKQKDFKNLSFKGLKNESKQPPAEPNTDNLRTSNHKNYGEPL